MMLRFVDEVMNHFHQHIVDVVHNVRIFVFMTLSTAPCEMTPVMVVIGMDFDMDLNNSLAAVMLRNYVRSFQSALGYLNQFVLVQAFHVTVDNNRNVNF